MPDTLTLPKGWKRVRLGEIAKVVSGFGFPIKYQGRDSGNYPFIKVDDLNRTSKYVNSAVNYIDRGTINILKAKIFPPGTIIFPKIGMALYHNKYRILRVFATFDNNIAGIILLNGSSEFIYYYILWTVDLKKIAGETAVPSVKKSILELVPIVFPPLPEQRKIAEILETIDNAIEKTDAIIEKYKRIKQGLMQELLTKGIDEEGRIRSEETHRFKDSPLGKIPEEWEVVELGEILRFKNGINFSQYEKDIKGILTLDVLNMFVESIAVDFSNAYRVNKKVPQSYILREGDILFVRSSVKKEGVGWTSLFEGFPEPTTFCGFIIRGRIQKKNILPEYIVYYLRSEIGRNSLISKSGQLAITNISQEMLSKVRIPLPSLPEQHRIAEILSQIDKAIEEEKAYKQKLERIKQGLMEDLLTGKVRVNPMLEGGTGDENKKDSHRKF